MEDDCMSNGPVQLPDLAGAPSPLPLAHTAVVSQEAHQELGEGTPLEAVPQVCSAPPSITAA